MLTVNSFDSLMVPRLCRPFFSETASIGGSDPIIPIHATVRRFGFSHEPLATSAAGTGNRISEGPSFLFISPLLRVNPHGAERHRRRHPGRVRLPPRPVRRGARL